MGIINDKVLSQVRQTSSKLPPEFSLFRFATSAFRYETRRIYLRGSCREKYDDNNLTLIPARPGARYAHAVCSFQLAITKLLYFRYLVAVQAIAAKLGRFVLKWCLSLSNKGSGIVLARREDSDGCVRFVSNLPDVRWLETGVTGTLIAMFCLTNR